jgi:hypothetical protein
MADRIDLTSVVLPHGSSTLQPKPAVFLLHLSLNLIVAPPWAFVGARKGLHGTLESLLPHRPIVQATPNKMSRALSVFGLNDFAKGNQGEKG